MSYTQVRRDSGAVLTQTFYSDEAALDADGAVTITITKSDGTAVETAAATDHGATGSGTYTYDLADQTNLDLLTVVWTGTFGGLVQTQTDYVEIVGGFYFTLPELRAFDPVALTTSKYPTAALATARRNAEAEIESICRGWAFVPRFKRVILSGNDRDTLIVPDLFVRSIRSLSVDGTAYTADELADLAYFDTGVITRKTLGTFSLGSQNVVVGYEHGYDSPPPNISNAALVLARHRLVQTRGSNFERASQMSTSEGMVFRLDMPGVDKTGIPEVDAVLSRYAAAPAVA